MATCRSVGWSAEGKEAHRHEACQRSQDSRSVLLAPPLLASGRVSASKLSECLILPASAQTDAAPPPCASAVGEGVLDPAV